MRGIDVAVLGVGYWGRKIVDEYANMPGVNIRAVSDRIDGNLKFCKERFGVRNLFHDYSEALEDPLITAVNVALPNSLHYQAAKDALEAGKHVLVEKPITLSSAEAKKLVDLAREIGLTLSVGHIFRFNNALNEVRQLARSNFFGRIYLMSLTWTNLEQPYEDRDVIMDLAPHTFDITNFILDAWPCRVTCTGAAYRRESMEEMAFISSEMPDGTIAHATLSWLTPRKVRQVEIIGENRSALIDAVTQEVIIYESGYTYRLGVERNNTIRAELAHFLRSIDNPTMETKNSGHIGVRTLEMIEGAKRSLSEGRGIEVSREP